MLELGNAGDMFNELVTLLDGLVERRRLGLTSLTCAIGAHAVCVGLPLLGPTALARTVTTATATKRDDSVHLGDVLRSQTVPRSSGAR